MNNNVRAKYIKYLKSPTLHFKLLIERSNTEYGQAGWSRKTTGVLSVRQCGDLKKFQLSEEMNSPGLSTFQCCVTANNYRESDIQCGDLFFYS